MSDQNTSQSKITDENNAPLGKKEPGVWAFIFALAGGLMVFGSLLAVNMAAICFADGCPPHQHHSGEFRLFITGWVLLVLAGVRSVVAFQGGRRQRVFAGVALALIAFTLAGVSTLSVDLSLF